MNLCPSCVHLLDQANFVLACQTTARLFCRLLKYTLWSSRCRFRAWVGPNPSQIDELIFGFAFIYQIKLTSCRCVKQQLARLSGDSHTLDEVVDIDSQV